jgi:LytR cell envelope-related transcriptional attenuator
MNERVPDSAGLPLRAMVMVLLFLGVIFLLLGWQALGSSGNSDDDTSPAATATSTSTPSPTTTTPASGKPQAEVHVYNISESTGLAKRTADQLKAATFNVAEPATWPPPPPGDITVTTVYYSEDGDKATADAVAKELGANVPVEHRTQALSDKLPGVNGVIVLVTA